MVDFKNLKLLKNGCAWVNNCKSTKNYNTCDFVKAKSSKMRRKIIGNRYLR